MTDVPDTAYRFAQFELQPATRELLVEGTPARLGGRAFDVLLALVEERRRTVSRNALFERAWPGRVVEDQNLRVQINALRRVLGEGAIATIPGRGYRFVLPLDATRRRASASLPKGQRSTRTRWRR